MPLTITPQMVTLYGTFTATGQSDSVQIPKGEMFLNITGVGTVQVERYSDSHAAWQDIEEYGVSSSNIVSKRGIEPVGGVYRLNCTAYSSDLNYTLSART
jgi:hypothetical protein